ncbi:unnamed protein product, partial [Rotaria sordida]
MRICLKYGIDPNVGGINPNSSRRISSHSHSQSEINNDLPRASPSRNGRLDYNNYYTTERLFTLPPLFLAAQRNNHYACLLLLKYGGNVNIRDEQNSSPLHIAARLQHNVSEILIYNHASITIENKYGDTPLLLWPIIKQIQTRFVDREFRKLCRKCSSNSKRYRFLTRDNDQYERGISLINNNNSINNGLGTGNGFKNFKRVFRHSGTDSYDSKSFKKSFSSQGSIGKSRRIITNNSQHNIQPNSIIRTDSRQISEEHDHLDFTYFNKHSHIKRK